MQKAFSNDRVFALGRVVGGGLFTLVGLALHAAAYPDPQRNIVFPVLMVCCGTAVLWSWAKYQGGAATFSDVFSLRGSLFGQPKVRSKVFGRMTLAFSCLSVVWGVLALAIIGYRNWDSMTEEHFYWLVSGGCVLAGLASIFQLAYFVNWLKSRMR